MSRARNSSIFSSFGLVPLLVLGVFVAISAGRMNVTTVQAQGVNIEEIFWCEEPQAEGELSMDECAAARDTILLSCTACHSFVPIVKSQKTEEEWDALLSTHRDRVTDLGSDDYGLVRQYLVTHYNPDQPVPELPPELENLGTNQAF